MRYSTITTPTVRISCVSKNSGGTNIEDSIVDFVVVVVFVAVVVVVVVVVDSDARFVVVSTLLLLLLLLLFIIVLLLTVTGRIIFAVAVVVFCSVTVHSYC